MVGERVDKVPNGGERGKQQHEWERENDGEEGLSGEGFGKAG